MKEEKYVLSVHYRFKFDVKKTINATQSTCGVNRKWLQLAFGTTTSALLLTCGNTSLPSQPVMLRGQEKKLGKRQQAERQMKQSEMITL